MQKTLEKKAIVTSYVRGWTESEMKVLIIRKDNRKVTVRYKIPTFSSWSKRRPVSGLES